jgi:hypothetical protein
LRLNGPASLDDDPALLQQFVGFGKRPTSVIRVKTEELYFHCPKSIMRARLWDSEAKVARSTLATLAEMVSDQLEYSARRGFPKGSRQADLARTLILEGDDEDRPSRVATSLSTNRSH